MTIKRTNLKCAPTWWRSTGPAHGRKPRPSPDAQRFKGLGMPRIPSFMKRLFGTLRRVAAPSGRKTRSWRQSEVFRLGMADRHPTRSFELRMGSPITKRSGGSLARVAAPSRRPTQVDTLSQASQGSWCLVKKSEVHSRAGLVPIS